MPFRRWCPKTALALSCAWAVSGGIVPAARAQTSTSYIRVLTQATERDFYAQGGRKHVGSLVHLHVKLTTFDRPATRRAEACPANLLEFANRSVPILVDRKSEHLAQLQRKRGMRRGGQICVKGRVVSPSWAPRGKCFLVAHSLKRAPARARRGERSGTSRSS
jgi:hypothetical protein